MLILSQSESSYGATETSVLELEACDDRPLLFDLRSLEPSLPNRKMDAKLGRRGDFLVAADPTLWSPTVRIVASFLSLMTDSDTLLLPSTVGRSGYSVPILRLRRKSLRPLTPPARLARRCCRFVLSSLPVRGTSGGRWDGTTKDVLGELAEGGALTLSTFGRWYFGRLATEGNVKVDLPTGVLSMLRRTSSCRCERSVLPVDPLQRSGEALGGPVRSPGGVEGGSIGLGRLERVMARARSDAVDTRLASLDVDSSLPVPASLIKTSAISHHCAYLCSTSRRTVWSAELAWRIEGETRGEGWEGWSEFDMGLEGRC